MLKSKVLKKKFSDRYDLHWEILATGLGNRNSLAMSLKAIDGSELRKGTKNDYSFGGLMLRERVEAVSAYSVELLFQRSRTWGEFSENDRSEFYDVWVPALRHLEEQGFINKESFKVCPKFKYISESSILWEKPEHKEISWREFVNEFEVESSSRESGLVYGKIRNLSRAKLREKVISREDIIDVNVFLLRFFRGKTEVFNESAKNYLIDLSQQFEKNGSSAGALILGLVKEFSQKDFKANVEILANQILKHYKIYGENDIDYPRYIYPIIFVMFTDWQTP